MLLVFGICVVALNKSLAKNEIFDADEDKDDEIVLKEKVPSFFLSILPILVLIVIIFGGSAMEVPNIVLIGLGQELLFLQLFFTNIFLLIRKRLA